MLGHLLRSLFSRPARQPAGAPSAAQELERGRSLHDARLVREAAEAYRRALAIDPALPHARELLGRALASLGEHAAAVREFDAAISHNPGSVSAHCDRALSRLALGDYAAAWPDYEWRWRRDDMQTIRSMFRQPWWDGGEIRGRTVLLFAEQGFGDAIQFARFIPLFCSRTGARVVLDCHPPLKGLLGRTRGVDAVLASDDEIARHEICLPLMSVPWRLGITAQDVPREVPYLSAPDEHLAQWSERLAGDGGFRVGLAWTSDPRGAYALAKNIALPMLAPLGDVTGATFYNLVPGAMAQIAPAGRMKVVDLGPHIRDFSDTAAIVACMDLVICVDTASAHVAGAMGKPVFVLLRQFADWRWLGQGERSGWYPTARLFRQRREGDWEPVVADVAAALREAVGRR